MKREFVCDGGCVWVCEKDGRERGGGEEREEGGRRGRQMYVVGRVHVRRMREG